VSLSTSNSNRICNYNDMFNSGASRNYFSSSSVNSLVAWRSATGYDLNSISVGPNFVSATDLHLMPATNTLLANKGIALAEVAQDIDGQLRNGCPDLGADEIDFSGSYFTDADNDLFGSSIITPTYFCANNPTAGYVVNNTDCNDANAAINPLAVEICGNSIDENCNGMNDDICGITNIIISMFIEGNYSGSSSMTPALYNSGVSSDSLDCDSVFVELHDTVNFSLLRSSTGILKSNGSVMVPLSPPVAAGFYYIAIKQRNSLEIWTKQPVFINGTSVSYDFRY